MGATTMTARTVRASLGAFAAIALTTSTSLAQPTTSVPISFTGDDQRTALTLHIHGSSPNAVRPHPGWDRVCASPCSTTLPAGTYRMALSKGDDERIELDEPLTLVEPSRLRGVYESRGSARALGYVLMVVGPLLGLLTLAVTSGREGEYETTSRRDERDGKVVAGVCIGGGIVGGMLMTLISDEASITITPMALEPGARASSAFDGTVPARVGLAYSF